jgi:hypothetical protein
VDQSIKVRLDQREIRHISIASGVTQGCCLSLILFNLYNEYVTNEAVEEFGDFRLGQVVHPVKYADDIVLQAKEETVLQGMIDRLIEI